MIFCTCGTFFHGHPFGRRIYKRPALSSRIGNLIELRLAHILFAEGSWLHLSDEIELRKSIIDTSREFVSAFERFLGRAARIADIAILGKSVSVPLSKADQIVDEDSLLVSLLKT